MNGAQHLRHLHADHRAGDQDLKHAPPGTDPEALKALKIGYDRLMKDEEFQKFAMKTFNIPIDFVTQEEGEAAIQQLLGKPDQAKIDRLKAYINEGSK